MMGTRRCAWAAMALGVLVPACATAGALRGSTLALSMLQPGTLPELTLAQRTIERDWGPPDSAKAEPRIPGWKSESLAMALSAAVPGAGQTYVGEGSGLWFALAEAAGWAAHAVFHRKATDLREDAQRFAGAPGDTASAWSFARWSASSASDPSTLEALYATDPGAFYHLIATDPSYLAGWKGDASATRSEFQGMHEHADHYFERQRDAAIVLWLNHAIASFDALRAARIHDLPLRNNLQLKLRSSWRRGNAGLFATLEKRF